MTPDELLERARENPGFVAQECARYLGSSPDSEELPKLHEACGWANYELGELTLAQQHGEAGIQRAAELDPPPSLAGLAQLVGATCIEQGVPARAETLITDLLTSTSGTNQILLRSVLAIIYGETDRGEKALEQYAKGLSDAEHAGDSLLIGRLLNNRAVLHLDAGDFSSAVIDLTSAEKIAVEIEHAVLRDISRHNRGVAAARSGRLSEALRLFGESAEGCRANNAGAVLARSLLDTGQLLLSAGLLDEGHAAAVEALGLFERGGAAIRAVECHELIARIHGAASRWDAARLSAERALALCAVAKLGQRALRRASALSMAALLAGLADEESSVFNTNIDVDIEVEVLQQLAEFPEVSVEAGVVLARAGRSDESRRCLQAVASSTTSTSALDRLHSLVAATIIAWIDNRDGEVVEIATEGLHLAAEFGAALGVTELRTVSLRRTRQLREFAIAAALRGRAPLESILQILELEQLVRITPEPILSDAERIVVARIRRTVASANTVLAEISRQRLRVEQSRLESDLAKLRRQREISTEDAARYQRLPAAGPVIHQFANGEDLHFVIELPGQTPVMVDALDRSSYERRIRALLLLLGLSADRVVGNAIGDHVRALKLLLQPMLSVIAGYSEATLVIDSSATFCPWSLLTDIAISQSVSRASAAAPPETGPTTSSTVAVAGPGLRFAEIEASSIVDASEIGELLRGSEATSTAVIRALGEAKILHLAAHGRFRSDNPLHSSIELVDGPLTFFDLLDTTAVPEQVVFSSCDVGRTTMGSPLSLAVVLLQRGCRSLIASSGRVNDRASMKLMRQVHASLATGATPAGALAAGQRRLQDDEPSVALFAAFSSG